ncbi:DUF4124 domain-containing protein [Herbaspirillum chlorophenolicum]|uniref:DUF4124 domain-containing protein n=1 Tax=Herbaspirillum chlorophenolicum TaxID=211589 RepID=A0ABW8F338_9BURK
MRAIGGAQFFPCREDALTHLPLFFSRLSHALSASVSALFLLSLPPMASAAIYKCIDAAGNATYSDHACTGAQELAPPPLPVVPAIKPARPAPPDSAKEKTEAAKSATQTRNHERQQLRAEAAQKKACAKLALRRRWAEQDVQQARTLPLRPNDKKLENAQRKARRADEQYRLECGGN